MPDDRDRFRPKTPPHGVRQQLARPSTERGRTSRAEEEMTPVTMIQIVREELKGDIVAVDVKVDAVAAKVDDLDSSLNSAIRGMAQLTGEVSVTNKLLPQMLGTIRDELRSRRAVDEKIVFSQTEVSRHREITAVDDNAADRKMRRAVKLKIVGWVFSAGGLGALIALAASRC